MNRLGKPFTVLLVLRFGFSLPCSAQEIINGNRTLLGNWDASGAATTKPLKIGTTLPASCGIGEMFFNSAATPGANVYVCTAANTWTQVQGVASGSGTVTNTSGALTLDMPVFGAGGNDSKAGTKTGTGDQVVVSQSPTIVSPTIADLTNMQHTHANVAGGGQLGISAISPAAISGNGAKLGSVAGTLTAGDCAKFDASGNIVDNGAACSTLTSVFGRTSAVTAQTGDYSFSQISGAVTVAQLPGSVEYTQSGAGAPSANCTAGHNIYLDTTNLDLWFCDAANTWKKLVATANSGVFSITGPNGTSPCGTPASGQDCLYFNTNDVLHVVNSAGTDTAAIMGTGPESATPNTNPASGFENFWFSSGFNAPEALNSSGVLFSMVQQDGFGNYSGTSFTASGSIAAGSVGGTAGCIHLDDNASVFDTTICAPSAGAGVTLTGPAPAASAGTGTNAGPIFTISGEAGGATTGSGTTAGGGAGISLTTGAGGAGSGGTNANGGNGGALFVNTGPGGAASGSGTAGSPGTITLQQNGNTVFSASGSGTLTIQAPVSTATTTLRGGNDATASASTLGPLIARGANVTGGSTAGSASGSATVQGGDNASTATSGTISGGAATFRPGEVTAGGGATQVNGQLFVQQPFVKGSTYNGQNVGYFSAAPASGAGPGNATASDCTSATGNCQQFIGVNNTADGNAAPIQTHGVATVSSNSSAQWSASDYVCVDPVNAAKFVAGGTVGCYGTRQAGIAVGDSSSVSSHPMLIQPANPMTTRAILTSQYTNSTTTFSNVTGGNTLQFAVQANTNYTITCHLYYQGASSAGLNVQFTGPSSPTAVAYGLTEPLSSSTINTQAATAFSTSLGAAVTTTGTNFDALVSLGLVNGTNSGTVTLQAKSSAAAQLQIQAGSFCQMQ